MCSQADDPSQHVSGDTLRAALQQHGWFVATVDDAKWVESREWVPVVRAALAAPATDEPTGRRAEAIAAGEPTWKAVKAGERAASATDEGPRVCPVCGFGSHCDPDHDLHVATHAASATEERVTHWTDSGPHEYVGTGHAVDCRGCAASATDELVHDHPDPERMGRVGCPACERRLAASATDERARLEDAQHFDERAASATDDQLRAALKRIAATGHRYDAGDECRAIARAALDVYEYDRAALAAPATDEPTDD